MSTKKIANYLFEKTYLKLSDTFAVKEDQVDPEDGDGALSGLSSSLRTVVVLWRRSLSMSLVVRFP